MFRIATAGLWTGSGSVNRMFRSEDWLCGFITVCAGAQDVEWLWFYHGIVMFIYLSIC